MRTIDSKYEIVKKLGEGFGGAVFLVESHGEKRALKQLRMRLDHACLSPAEILDNFKQEFSILKNLNHPHILQILDFGLDSREKFYYFTTEFIEGEDIFSASKWCSVQELEEIFVQILRALSYLHRQKVYHLDIKPQNIMVFTDEAGKKTAKLIDFGLSGLKKKGLLAGSPGYISPEAILGEPLDGRADLYSLGITWYSCLLGKNPFETKNLKETLALHKVWIPPPLSHPSNSIPAYLDAVLGKMLKKNPNERYHHPDQAIRDINWAGAKNYPLETDATALSYLPGKGRLVGRKAEWSQLLALFERVFVNQSEGKTAVAICGPPGTGKSRLLKELKYHAQLHTIAVLEGPENLQSPLNAASLILIEDADEELYLMAERWLTLFHQHAVMIVLTGLENKTLSGNWHRIALKNLSKEEVKEFTESVLGFPDPPGSLVEELFHRTEGNPLYLTELLRSLIESHQLFDPQGRWSPEMLNFLGIDFARLQVPSTLSEFCRKKFEQLSPDTRKILLMISLTKVPLQIHDLSDSGLNLSFAEWKELEEENILALSPEGEVRLLNPNFRDWIRQWFEPEELSELHQSLGEIFRRDEKRREWSSYHFGFGTGTTQERLDNLLRHGEFLYAKNLWIDALKSFEDALGLTSLPADKVAVQFWMVRTLFRAGQHARALTILEESAAVLRKERENPKQWRWVQQTLREMGSIYIKEGKFDLAHESLEASRVLLEQHEDDLIEGMILKNLKSSLLLREGKLLEAAQISEENHRAWLTWPKADQVKILNNELANIYIAQGKIEAAIELLEVYAAFFEECGQVQKQAYALYGLAICHFYRQNFEEASAIHQKCAEICRCIKNEELLFHVFNELGNLSYGRMNWDEASVHYEHALELAQHLSDPNGSVAIAINLALVYLKKRDPSSARLYLNQVIETLETHPSSSLHQVQFLIQAYLALGKLFLEERKAIESRDCFRDALHVIRGHTALERFRFSALTGLVKSDILLKRREEARAFLAELNKGVYAPDEQEELTTILRQFDKLEASSKDSQLF